jgi:hypothetical protein
MAILGLTKKNVKEAGGLSKVVTRVKTVAPVYSQLANKEDAKGLIMASSQEAAQTVIDKIIAAKGGSLSDGLSSTLLAYADNKIGGKEFKLAKKTIKSENKTSRSYFRNEARKVAYENGIDPNAGVANAIASGVGNIANGVVGVAHANALGRVGSSAFAGGASQAGQNVLGEINAQLQGVMGAIASGMSTRTAGILPETDAYGIPVQPKSDNTILFIGGAALLAFLFFFKKGRK